MNSFYSIGEQYIAGAVQKINEMYAWLNDNAQDIIDIATDGKRNADGCLDKRTMDKIRPILATCPCRVYIDKDYIRIDTNFQAGEHQCSYAKESCWLSGFEYVPKDMLTVEAVNDLLALEKEQSSEHEKVQSALMQTQHALKHFNRFGG